MKDHRVRIASRCIKYGLVVGLKRFNEYYPNNYKNFFKEDSVLKLKKYFKSSRIKRKFNIWCIDGKYSYTLIDGKYKCTVNTYCVDNLNNYYFRIMPSGYIATICNGRTIYIHRMITKNKFKVTDHINGNKLDNRISNLRNVSYSISSFNRNTKRDVSYRSGKWESYITFKRKRIPLGRYVNKNDALLIREFAELLYYGETIKNNFCKSSNTS